MKSVLNALIVSLVAYSGAAHAEENILPRNFILIAEIEHVAIDPRLQHLQGVTGGNVSIDPRRERIVLTLDRPFYCPEGMVCAQVMPEPVVISLPLVSRERDACGSIVYTAEADRRPVDGDLKVIEVRDNRTNTCRDLAAMPPTSISYQTVSAGFGGPVIETFSTFAGKALERHIVGP